MGIEKPKPEGVYTVPPTETLATEQARLDAQAFANEVRHGQHVDIEVKDTEPSTVEVRHESFKEKLQHRLGHIATSDVEVK